MRKLNEIIAIADFQDWHILTYRTVQPLNLPTEIVITEPGSYAPLQARAYRTDMYFFEGEIVDYPTINKQRNFRGTADYESVWLLEIWHDQGDDGHVFWNMYGYAFITEKSLEGDTYPEDFVCSLWP